MATVEFVFGVETLSRLVIQLLVLNFLGVEGIIMQNVGTKLTDNRQRLEGHTYMILLSRESCLFFLDFFGD